MCGGSVTTSRQNLIFGIAFSPDSKFLLIGDLDGVARLWNIDADQDTSGDRDALIKLGAHRVAHTKACCAPPVTPGAAAPTNERGVT